jgi:small GTP-binding protein
VILSVIFAVDRSQILDRPVISQYAIVVPKKVSSYLPSLTALPKFTMKLLSVPSTFSHGPMTDSTGPSGRQTFKFIVIGSSGVGKTAILRRLVDDIFTTDSQSTIGVEFLATTIDVEGQHVKLQIWDTAGQERFRSIAKAYFRSAIGVILVFDLSERKSFDDLNQWLSDIHALCDPNAVVTLIGNKSDLVDQQKVTSNEAEAFARLHQLTYFETSALGGDNIQEAFHRTAAAILRRNIASDPHDGVAVPDSAPAAGCAC